MIVEGPQVGLDMIRWHADPFFAECRAYGRIQEEEAKATKRPRKQIAAHSYGFIESTEEDKRLEDFVRARKIDLDYPEGTSLNDRNAYPLRAIVKEFVDGDLGVPSTRSGGARMLLGRIKALNRMGVYNGDIRSSNIKNGLLLDFGLARTEPHCLFHERLPAMHVTGMKHEDLVKFDEMIEEEGVKTRVRALAYPRMRLRQRK